MSKRGYEIHPAAEELLRTSQLDNQLRNELLSSVPFVFDGQESFQQWRATVAEAADLQPGNLYLSGSAAFGFSLAPRKFGRPFRERKSDIDIAIINQNLFIFCWDQVLQAERNQALRFSYNERQKIKTDIYWGHIMDHVVPNDTDVSRTLRRTKSATTGFKSLRGYKASVRVYRRPRDLIGYVSNSVREARSQA